MHNSYEYSIAAYFMHFINIFTYGIWRNFIKSILFRLIQRWPENRTSFKYKNSDLIRSNVKRFAENITPEISINRIVFYHFEL